MEKLSRLLRQNIERLPDFSEQAYQLLGPVTAPIEKISNKYREHIIIKTNQLKKLRNLLDNIISTKQLSRHHADYLEIDFDPTDLL